MKQLSILGFVLLFGLVSPAMAWPGPNPRVEMLSMEKIDSLSRLYLTKKHSSDKKHSYIHFGN